ncbi:MAG: hypothetical protein K2K44_09955, partial [Oscillospiraceae bacterium]|nr:hypothetical protein [Oscillospiraceae bacterium]
MTAKIKKAAAAFLAAAITIGVGSVGAGAADNSKKDELSSAMSKLNNVKLKNKTVTWLSYYELEPTSKGAVKSADAELFERKYGGKI